MGTLKKIITKAFTLLNKEELIKIKVLTLANVIVNIVDIFILSLLLAIISLYSGSQNRIIHILPKWLNNAQSVTPIIILLCLFIVKNICAYFIFRIQSRFVFEIASRLSKKELLKYLNGSFSNYINTEQSKIVQLATHEPIIFAQQVLTSIQTIFTELSLTLLAFVAITVYKPKIFILLSLILIPPIAIISIVLKKRLKNVRDNINSDSINTNQYLYEAFDSYVESSIYNKKNFFLNRFISFQNKLNHHLMELQIMQWIPSKFIEIFAVLGLFILIFINKVIGYQSDLINISAFFAAAYKIIPGIVRIANMSAYIKTYEYTIDDLKNDSVEVVQKEQNDITTINSIQLNNISYSIQGTKILDDINLEIKKADFIAIFGDSGKGKSTMINMILGFLNPTQGTIHINKKNTNFQDRIKFQHLCSYVKQDTFLINDTIQTNITLSEDKDDYDELKLLRAIALSGLESFIQENSDGLKKIVSENGKNLSGGQKQRIAIARALYKDADLIILDEPFNELDENSEISILNNLKEIASEGKIVLLISHSKTSLNYCNKILYLNGKTE